MVDSSPHAHYRTQRLYAWATAGGQIDTATALATESRIFKVSYQSELDPAEINKMHGWVLHLEDANGKPVEKASIQVKGWMPDHGHGLPTAPRPPHY